MPTSTPQESPEPTPSGTLIPTPPVQVSGPAILSPDDRLDLDSNLIDGTADADLHYQIDSEENLQLTPLEGALVGTFGLEEPGLDACQNAILGPGDLPVEDLPAGTYLCYRTNQDRYGWAQLQQINVDDLSLELEILTWELP